MKKSFVIIGLCLIVFFAYSYSINSSPLLVCLFGTHNTTIQNINEEIVGQGPEHVRGFLYNKYGDTVGYPLPENYSVSYFYVKENKTFGPFRPKPENATYGNLDYNISRGQEIYRYLTPDGWPSDLWYRSAQKGDESSRSSNGHTLDVRGAGGTFYLTGERKQSEIIYDGNVVGKETSDCEFYQPVVREGLVLSKDGLHYAYVVKFKTLGSYGASTNPSYVVFDGKKTKVFDDAIENLHFEDDLLVFNTMNRSNEFLRITIPVILENRKQ